MLDNEYITLCGKTKFYANTLVQLNGRSVILLGNKAGKANFDRMPEGGRIATVYISLCLLNVINLFNCICRLA